MAENRDPIGEILKSYKSLAVVGLSSRPARPSHGVAAYMQSRGYRIIPVNPQEKEVLGQKAYAKLQDVPEATPVVVIFRRPEYVPEIVEQAIAKGAKVVWMQESIEHDAAARRAHEAGLIVVQDRCILKEHSKRFGTPGT